MIRPQTLDALAKSNYKPRSVKDEIRENTIRKLRAGEPLFPGIIGYDHTVIPQLVNGILSRHDMLVLGLRGQAKTRILRAMPALLDEWLPVVDGVDAWDDPLAPRFKATQAAIARQGGATPIRWLHRDERYREKLATPDVTIADLIGEIDLIKHAEGRYLADESIMHMGLIPRTNRGIFAINELPDLSPRIQVGLFNVLEERDVQIRGFPIRLPLDVMLIFSANPEDYTNRGRIVTPLKDRIGSVIRTHYPQRVDEAIAITRENAWLRRGGDYRIETPPHMELIIESFAGQARRSPHVNQASGVSVRCSIANMENVVSSAERRAIMLGEAVCVPRISDLRAIAASCRGKLELMMSEGDDAEEKLMDSLLGEAVKTVAESRMAGYEGESVIEHFARPKTTFEVGDDLAAESIVAAAQNVRGLVRLAAHICAADGIAAPGPQHMAAAIELALEGLYVSNKLSKYLYDGKTFYKR